MNYQGHNALVADCLIKPFLHLMTFQNLPCLFTCKIKAEIANSTDEMVVQEGTGLVVI